jgi:hypothetical protein
LLGSDVIAGFSIVYRRRFARRAVASRPILKPAKTSS